MATFTYAWSALPRFSLDPSYAATSADIDDIYAELPVEAHGKLTDVTITGGSWYWHTHGGSVALQVLVRKKSTGEWLLAYEVFSSGQINLNGLSFTSTVTDVVDAIRFRSNVYQSTAYHSMNDSGSLALTVVPAAQSATGGGGGGGAGVGNMLGGFALGSTMLGADPAKGGGGAGGAGQGAALNMLGGFHLGNTMLGADPGSGGDGDSPPITVGAIFPVSGTIAAAATVTGAFATFVFPVAGTPVGVASIQNAYLNSNWALEATTVNPTGLTKVPRTAPGSITIDLIQGQKSRLATIDVSAPTLGSSFSASVFARPLAGGAEVSVYSVSGSAGSPFRLDNTGNGQVDAGTNRHITRVVLTTGGTTVTWDWLVEPRAVVEAVIFSPIGLRSTVDADSTVTGDLTNSVLRGNTIEAEADVTGTLTRTLRISANTIIGNASVVGESTLSKVLAGDIYGHSTSSGDVVQTYYSNGTSSVTANVEIYLLSGQRSNSSATVVANMRRNEGFQGDSIADASLVSDIRLNLLLGFVTPTGTASTVADLTYPRPISGTTVLGSSTVTGILAIYNVRGEIAGQATVTANQGYNGALNLRATSTGVATLEFDLRIRGRFGQQTINGTSTVTGRELNRVQFVEGTPTGFATVTFDALTVHTIPPSPIIGEAEVVAHATLDARYGGLIEGKATVAPTFPYVLTTVGTGTSQGTGDVRARLYIRPQDFEASTSDGTAAVLGQVLLENLRLTGKSEGGKIYSLDANGKETASFSLNLASAYLSAKAPFAPVIIVGFAEFDRAILLLNDSGLISGNSRLDAALDILSKQYFAKSVGTSTVRGKYTLAKDLEARALDAYTGVGRWFPNGFNRIYHFDFSLTMAPIPDLPEHAGLPGNALRHGANVPGADGVSVAQSPTVDSFIDGHVWDGTYDEWRWGVDVLGLSIRDYPELWDPATSGGTPNTAQPYAKYPGPMRRQYQLLQPGKPGTWMVDTRGPGFNDKAMRAAPVGEARFDEPQSTVDMDLELKSSMRGRIEGQSFVTAFALLLSFRKLMIEGNVTALRALTKMLSGNLAKSPEALLPMNRDDVDLLNPVRQSNAMYV